MKKWFKAKGCSLYCDFQDDRDTIEFTDIVVDDDIEELQLAGASDAMDKIAIYDLKNCSRSFPNVKKLVIGMLTRNIIIKNRLFPNVREVESHNSSFKSGDMLIWQTEDSENVLLNTFCKKKNEKIDLKEIRIIADWAFDGCMSTNVINEEAIKACEKYAFSNSALLMQPFTNGLRFAGRILIDAEEGADACLPKDFVMAGVWISADLRKLKSLRIENYANLKIVALITKIPKRIIFADKKQADIKEILQDISNTKLEYFDVESKQCGFKSIDGVLYSKRGNRLIGCPAGRKHLVIPEGVTKVEPKAFFYCNIESVEFPDSLNTIGEKAFYHCTNLKSVKFGSNIEKIGRPEEEGRYFAYCYELKEIEFPASLKYLGPAAFYGCKNLKKITLNNGLEIIDKDAFNYCPSLEEVTFPYSLTRLEGYNFTYTKKINMKFNKSLLICLAMALDGTKPQDYYIDVFFSDLNRHLILPGTLTQQGRYNLLTEMQKSNTIDDIIQNTKIMFRNGYTQKCRYRTAMKQYKDSQVNEARFYLVFEADKIIVDILESNHEEDMIQLLALKILPEEKLKMIQEYIGIARPEWTTSLAYVLESLKNCSKKTNMYDI